MTDTHKKGEGRTPDLVERLHTMAAMLGLGERVSLAYEVALIELAVAEIERLRADLAEVEAEIDNLEGEQCGYDTELLALQTRAESAETTMQEAAADSARLRAKLAEAESTRDYALSEMKSARIYRNIETGHARDAEARAEAAEKRLAEARAVIEPFARLAADQLSDGGPIMGHYITVSRVSVAFGGEHDITPGELRAAAKWMEKNR